MIVLFLEVIVFSSLSRAKLCWMMQILNDYQPIYIRSERVAYLCFFESNVLKTLPHFYLNEDALNLIPIF